MPKSIHHQQTLYGFIFFISGILSLAILASSLSAFLKSNAWQYLALGSIGIFTVFTHLIVWLNTINREHSIHNMLALAATQLICLVILPLLTTDYWKIAPFLFLVIPVSFSIVFRLQRILLFIVLTLLSAGMMIIVDLWGRPPGNDLISSLVIWSVIAVECAHTFGLVLLFKRYYLKADIQKTIRVDIATQYSLVFTIISGLAILTVTGGLISKMRSSQIAQVGKSFQSLSENIAELVTNDLELQLNNLTYLSDQESVIEKGLVASNRTYPQSREVTETLLTSLKEKWRSSPENSPFILRYRNNPQTEALSRFRSNNNYHNNLILTDRKGWIVATLGKKPKKFHFADETWWQTAWNGGLGGIYIGNLSIDSDKKIVSIFIAVSILNRKTNQNIGVLASTYQLRTIQRNIKRSKPKIASEIDLLTPKGLIIASTEKRQSTNRSGRASSPPKSLHNRKMTLTEANQDGS